MKAQWFIAGKLILKQALPQPDYVYGRELSCCDEILNLRFLQLRGLFFKLGGLVSGKVLPRPPLDGPDKKH